MEYYSIITKLIGPVDPVGETNADNARFENLRNLIELTDTLIGDIQRVSTSKDRPEHSMSRAGKMAGGFLSDLYDCLGDEVDDA